MIYKINGWDNKKTTKIMAIKTMRMVSRKGLVESKAITDQAEVNNRLDSSQHNLLIDLRDYEEVTLLRNVGFSLTAVEGEMGLITFKIPVIHAKLLRDFVTALGGKELS